MIAIPNLVRDLNLVREKSPLVHNITNYVVMNNTANALLAVGASPVMAHSVDEVAEMTSIASALVINIGTLEAAWVEAMLIAGKVALERGIPLVLDPVGSGATAFRNEVCQRIMEECQPSIIRGNASEISALCKTGEKTKGVDSTSSSETAILPAKTLAEQTGAVVVISGETDYITDGLNVEKVLNGNRLMTKVTGMGCTATAIVASFAAINPNRLEAAHHAMSIMGIAGEIAARTSIGNGSMQMNFLDQLCLIDEERIKQTIRIAQ